MFTTLALAAALSAPVPKSVAADLKWKFVKGDTFYVVSEQESTATVNIGGGGVAQKAVSTAGMSYKVTVTSADAKGTVLSVEFLTYEASLDSGGGKQPMKAEGVAGKVLTFTLDADLKATKVDGEEEFVKAVGQGGVNVLAHNGGGIRHLLDDPLRSLPGKGMAKGDTWAADHEQLVGEGTTLKRSEKGTVGGSEGGLTRLDVVADRTMESDGKAGIQMTLKGEKGKRTVLFDTKAGRVRKVTDEYTLAGDLMAGGQAITISVDMKGTVSVSDDKPKADK